MGVPHKIQPKIQTKIGDDILILTEEEKLERMKLVAEMNSKLFNKSSR